MIYEYPDGREAAFDIHTSWVNPENFPGYVEQEVQFRFDNGVWNGHSRKRGVELTVEGKTPTVLKTTMNTHYNGDVRRAVGRTDAARLRHRGPPAVRRRGRVRRVRRRRRATGAIALEEMRALRYNDLAADRAGRGRRAGDGGDPRRHAAGGRAGRRRARSTPCGPA